MATNDSGKQYFGIGLDLDELRRNAEESKQIFANIGNDAVEQGSLIDQAFGQQGAAQGLNVFSSSALDLEAHIEQLRNTIAQIDSACDQQQAEIQRLNEEYDNLAVALDKNIAEGSEEERNIQERMQAIREEAAERRNLIATLQEQASALETEMQTASQELEKMSATSESHDSIMVKMLGGYENYKAILAQLPQPIQSVIGGINSMSKAGLAFIATPLGATIGAIVLALQALKTWFNSSAEGQMAFAKVSGYVNGILGQLKEIVIAVGKAIYTAFTDPQKAISALAKAIRTNIENRFKAIGQLGADVAQILKSAFTLDFEGVKKGVKDLTNSFLQLGTGVENVTDKLSSTVSHLHEAATESSKIAVETRQLEVEMSKYNEEAAKTRGTIAQLDAVARDMTKSQEERNKALQESKRLTQSLTDQEKAFAQKEEDLIARRNALTTNSIEDENRLRDARAKTAQVEAQGYQNMLRYVRMENSINRAGGTGGSASGSSGVVQETNAQEKALQQSGDLLAKLVLDNTRKEISAMQDGHAKRMAELEQERVEQLDAITKMEVQFAQLNVQAGVSTGDNGLTTLQQEQIDRSRANVENAYKNGLNDILDGELADIRTYEQKRYDIEKEYAEKRKALYEDDGVTLREGVTRGNVSNLDQQENQALEALDAEVLAKQENFESWTAMISQLALEQLEVLLAEAEEQLEAAKENGTSAEDVALAKAQVDALNKQVDKMKTSPQQSSVNDWTKLYKTLQTCEREFERVGDAIGGTAGTIVKTAGQIASAVLSAFNGVEELFSKTDDLMNSVQSIGESTVNVLSETAEGASSAMKGAATGAASAISTVEKASVILTIISAALQVATAIVNLFNNDNKYEKEIEELQRRIDQLQWELDNSGAVRIQNELGDALTNVRKIYQQVTDEVLNLHNVSTQSASKMVKNYAKVVYQNEILEKSIDEIVKKYATLDYTADKALGTQKYKDASDQLKNYAEQLLLIQEQYDKELAKKKTDQDKLQEYEQEEAEIVEKMNDLLNEMVEDIIGGSAEDIAKQLGDAFIEAFQAGEDAAQAWADTVDDIVQDIVKQLLIQEYIEPEIGKIFDKYKAKWFNENGEFAGTEAVIDDMDAFSDELNAACGEFAEAWTAISDAMGFASESTREATQKGIASASQESIDELNGRATAIQGHTYTINENTKLLVTNTNLILQSVMNIDSNTEGLSTRMERVEDYVKELRDTTNNIALRGIKVA